MTTPTHDFGALAEFEHIVRQLPGSGSWCNNPECVVCRDNVARVEKVRAALRAAEEQAKRVRELESRLQTMLQTIATWADDALRAEAPANGTLLRITKVASPTPENET